MVGLRSREDGPDDREAGRSGSLLRFESGSARAENAAHDRDDVLSAPAARPTAPRGGRGMRGGPGGARRRARGRGCGRPAATASASAARWCMLTPRASSTTTCTPRMCPRSSRRRFAGGEVIERLLYVGPGDGPSCTHEEEIPFYRAPEARAAARQQPDRPDLHRRLHRHRRLRRPGDGALERRARSGDRGGQALRPARPRRRRLPHRPEVGGVPATPAATTSTSSATPTRATRAPTWTARSARGQPAQRPRGHDHRRLRHRRHARVTSTCATSTRWPSSSMHERHRAGPRARPARRRTSSAPASPSTCRSRAAAGAFVCGESTALMRSIEGKGGEPRQRPSTPSERGLWRQAHRPQQRRDLGQRARDHRSRAPTGSPPSAPNGIQGHQDLLARRQGQEHRPGRGADGHHPARDRLRHRRRDPRRQGVQGRADRRPVRRLPARRDSSTCRSTSTR